MWYELDWCGLFYSNAKRLYIKCKASSQLSENIYFLLFLVKCDYLFRTIGCRQYHGQH